ncbi:hypothetical protein FQA39_LY06451 [Lamprigera yunnana]|nr:hypothetical protein FQA39_LY06451 [Lamprigera yunnana]
METTITILSNEHFSKICRVCLLECEGMHSIFSEIRSVGSLQEETTYLYEILMNISSIRILLNDGLPTMICTNCMELTHAFYKFQQQCNHSQELLDGFILSANIDLQEPSDKDVKLFDLDVNLASTTPLLFDEVQNEVAQIADELLLSYDCLKETDDLSNNNNTEIKVDELLKLENIEESSETEEDGRKKKVPKLVKKMKKAIQQKVKKNCENIKSTKTNKTRYVAKINEEGLKIFECTYCGKTYKHANSIRVHLRTHSAEKSFMCNYCGKAFFQYGALTYHLRGHTGEQPHECNICGKRYRQSGTLTAHMRVHTGQKPFLCSVCGRGFRQAPDLGYHMRTHTKERPYMCNVCGKTMRMQCHLVQHLRMHTGERPFQCTECGKSFPSSTRLKRHAIIHTGLKPFTCDVCSKAFNRLSTLKVHAKIHVDKPPYVCLVCVCLFIKLIINLQISDTRKMWKAHAGAQISVKNVQDNDDDWETDPDFVNDVNEVEQRWGASTVEGSGRTAGAINMEQLRRETEEADALKKKKDLIDGPNSSFGYGGKFGIQQDRMDNSAVGHDYIGKVEKHASQKDYSAGFGGKYGVQSDRVDKAKKHASQKDYSSGFGGKFGVQSDRQDKSAVGWDHVEKIEKHESQKDYSKGFGGKYGVQTDRQDKSAVGWDHHEAAYKHESQTDHKIGFGGKFGIQTDRMDKSAVAFGEEPSSVGTNYIKTKPDIGSAKPQELRAHFENMKVEESTTRLSTQTSISKSNVQSRAAAFNTPVAEISTLQSKAPKQLDQSKIAFLQQSNELCVSPTTKAAPGQLDYSKLSQFNNQESVNAEKSTTSQVQEELTQLKQLQIQKIQQETVQSTEEQIYENFAEVQTTKEPETPIVESCEAASEEADEIVDTGLTAVAVYDYQAGAEDEISFDPDDIITHVEKIDEGWWRGMCNGSYGLFPANYVQLQ